MTRSYGSGPDWQPQNKRMDARESEPRLREGEPRLRESDAEYDDEDEYAYDDQPTRPSTGSRRAPDSSGLSPNWERKLDNLSRYDESEETVKAERIEFGKRLVALILDLVAAYVVAACVSVVPFINAFLTQNIVMTVFLLIRDFLFQGRGVGKNLMGLQVVDVRSGYPCTLMQSIKRNVIILGPLLLMQSILIGLQIFSAVSQNALSNKEIATMVQTLNDAIPSAINAICGAYVLLVIPYEAYRAYNRADGRRFGDQFAGTAVIEAPMDFSQPIARQ